MPLATSRPLIPGITKSVSRIDENRVITTNRNDRDMPTAWGAITGGVAERTTANRLLLKVMIPVPKMEQRWWASVPQQSAIRLNYSVG
jgi:hypothetical protein